MRKKRIISGVLATSVALAATLGGCSLVSTNTAADMNQVIAEVEISKAVALDDSLKDYKEAVGTAKIIKRELVAYYINVGYSYVQNDNYAEVFNMLLDALIENAVLVQYSTMYLLKDKATNTTSELGYDQNALANYMSKSTEVEKYEYLFGGEDSKDNNEVKIAKYSLYQTINNSIDSIEKDDLDEDASSSGSDTRTTPDGVDTQKDDYYPADDNGNLDYNIYTGYDGYTINESGAYKDDMLEGSNMVTRMSAYHDFISNLSSSAYNLVDKRTEDLSDVLSLNYIQNEYVSQLEQRVINKYYDIYEAEQEKLLKSENKEEAYSYVKSVYEDLLRLQTKNYETESSFTSAMDGMSDSSFVLYAPNTEEEGTYGFVYNILLPFSEAQNDSLKALQKIYADDTLDGGYKAGYYEARNNLLAQIETTDQRAAWFNGETEYAFNAADKNGLDGYYKTANNSSWLFFENNVANSDKYEQLEKYAGQYPYNGKVVQKSDDSYLLIPNKLGINEMLKEFEEYIKHVSGLTATTTLTANYGANLAANLYKDNTVADKDKKIDYSNFVYASGKVDFGESEQSNRMNVLKNGENASNQYKVLSAVNELQYAYTTDTSVLSQYLGYSVQAGDTSYIKEFEYAAHQAVNAGAGNYVVCAGDYGWHLIYVTYTFDAQGLAQQDPHWENVTVEGTFENLFYEWIKSNDLQDISSKRRSQIITRFKVDESVTKYQDRYQNLLDLGNN